MLTLAPLETTGPISSATLKKFNFDQLTQANILRVIPQEQETRVERAMMYVATAGFWFVVLGVVFNLLKQPWAHTYWWVGSTILGIGVVLAIVSAKRLFSAFGRFVSQGLSISLLFMLGIGIPTLTIYLFNDTSLLLSVDLNRQPLILARAMQLVFIVTATILPGWLYFLFDRQCLTTLRDRFEHCIFRLDPDVSTLTDVRAKYGKQMEEIYGQETGKKQTRLVPRGTPFPILAATVLFALGWIYALLPVGNAGPMQPGDFFIPRPTATAFGFLGAYFFAVNDVLHRYVRRDLKPKAYSSVCVRIVIVSILAGVISSLPNALGQDNSPRRILLGLIFLVGIVPETGLTYIRELVRPVTGKLLRTMEEKEPLTNLDGVDLYDRTRLLDEGVTNIEALAHHDFVDLMMETRIPVPRLVDWIDQSILYLHVQSEPYGREQSVLRTALRQFGIRTATDLLQVYEMSKLDGTSDALLRSLSRGTTETEVNPLKAIIDALGDDEWLDCIRHWRIKTRTQDEIWSAAHESATQQPLQPV